MKITYKRRYKSRKAQVRAILKYYPVIQSVLYVGAHPDRLSFIGTLGDVAGYIDVIEVWPENVQYLKSVKYFRNVILGDVRKITTIIEQKYDLVFWWHGPEHISQEELSPTIIQLKSIGNCIITGCPWGCYVQEEVYGNPYEKHINSLYPNDLEVLGFLTSTTGEKNQRGSNVAAWWDRMWETK